MALLCPVMTAYSTDITESARCLPRTRDVKDVVAYQSYSDDLIKKKIKELRHKVYLIVISDQIAKKIPQVKRIKTLTCSEMDKCVVFISGIGMSSEWIADFLQSDPRSIMTIRSRRKAEILNIFGRPAGE